MATVAAVAWAVWTTESRLSSRSKFSRRALRSAPFFCTDRSEPALSRSILSYLAPRIIPRPVLWGEIIKKPQRVESLRPISSGARLGAPAAMTAAYYFRGEAASISWIRFSRPFISPTRRSSIFLRSELVTMLMLAASRTTLAGSERRRVMRP